MRRIAQLLRENPVVALLGARQVGKTTLATALRRTRRGNVTWFDLENPPDLRQLDEPFLALEPLRGLVIIDEIQNRPELFPVLRVLADRAPLPARFLVLGERVAGTVAPGGGDVGRTHRLPRIARVRPRRSRTGELAPLVDAGGLSAFVPAQGTAAKQ